MAKVAGVTLNLDANARKTVKSLILVAKIIETVTTKVGVIRKLNYVFAKNQTNVSMVLHVDMAIMIVAKEAGVILNLDVCAGGEPVQVEREKISMMEIEEERTLAKFGCICKIY